MRVSFCFSFVVFFLCVCCCCCCEVCPWPLPQCVCVSLLLCIDLLSGDSPCRCCCCCSSFFFLPFLCVVFCTGCERQCVAACTTGLPVPLVCVNEFPASVPIFWTVCVCVRFCQEWSAQALVVCVQCPLMLSGVCVVSYYYYFDYYSYCVVFTGVSLVE